MAERRAGYGGGGEHEGYQRDGVWVPAGVLYSLVVRSPIPEVGPGFCQAVLGQNAYGVGLTHEGTADVPIPEQSDIPPEATVFSVDIMDDLTHRQRQFRLGTIAERVAVLANDLSRAPIFMLEHPFAK